MPNTRVIKPKSVELKPKVIEVNVKSKTVESLPSRHLKPAVVQKKRASSCTRGSVSSGHQKHEPSKLGISNHAVKCERRGKTCTTAPKNKNMASEQTSGQMTIKSEYKVIHEVQSHKAFTVIPPNPKKRSEIQKQAEAELAALEDLRLRRAMGYISLTPSTVGGRLTLEEVRNKQQQDVLVRRTRQVK